MNLNTEKICTNCGKEVTEDSNVCIYCGNKLYKEKELSS